MILKPSDPELDQLCAHLHQLAKQETWPAASLQACGDAGVFRWFLSKENGGLGWSDSDVVRGYLKLSAACLTTTFIITQRTGACRRIGGSANTAARERLLPDLASGKTLATVGISHLTTSRRHLGKPVLGAKVDGDTILLDGYSPWVTGGVHADTLVVGATLDDGRELLATVPGDAAGVSAEQPADLVGLTGSATGMVKFSQVSIGADQLLAGPIENVMKAGVGARTGGLETSTLAIGLAMAAAAYIRDEAEKRPDLSAAAESLAHELSDLETDLLSAAAGEPLCSTEQLRSRANSIALRSTQAALSAAKGAGYVTGHPVGRWCREALFFLVWSCPQPVQQANLCELAGILD
ncbi:acyl-CoA dehydrogenase family protein [Blastopirellula retiformator]|uniref:Acyl-CoA dehydrogenase, short-chain specific n=1 Tax=Blastopirellula retiformator TaxID=2527970 RepID=A0A5C5VNQ5_9BACT|nr:acyl-CoA dehydrogenase family protein [Blastopirellula retiformator]TWT39379.1 Acyl-CoA dehydrogenase, short-chain specific [Blastopirellula retiformator]